MSAMTGICDFRAMTGSASASSVSGTATRTIWQPEAVSSAICCSVALMSAVLVVVIDCTLTGWSLPTPTLPTISWRVVRRGARTGGGSAGMPRPTEGALATRIPVRGGRRGGAGAARAARDRRRWPWPRVSPFRAGRCRVLLQCDRVDDVGDEQQPRQGDEQPGDDVGDGHQPGDVERAGVGPATPAGDDRARPLVERPGAVPAGGGARPVGGAATGRALS